MRPGDLDSLRMAILGADITGAGFRAERIARHTICEIVDNFVDMEPTLDVEPVVHCRDCVFFNTTKGNPKCDCMMALAGVLNGSDYCSRGIRKG